MTSFYYLKNQQQIEDIRLSNANVKLPTHMDIEKQDFNGKSKEQKKNEHKTNKL